MHTQTLSLSYQQNMTQPSLFQVLVKVGDCTLQYRVPGTWSVNKLKCLLDSENPKLKFDEFQLKLKSQLLRGAHRLSQIQEASSVIQLEIVRVSSEVKFKEYYEQTIGKFLEETAYEKQPIFQPQIKNLMEKVFFSDFIRQQEDENDKQLQEREADLPRMLMLLRTIGLLFFGFLLFSKGQKFQIGIIATIFICYFLIELYSNHQARIFPPQNVQQNQQQPIKNSKLYPKNEEIHEKQLEKQNQPSFKHRMKFMVLLRLFKLIQVIISFWLTFFPNWSIQMHFRVNGAMIAAMKNKLNSLQPRTFQEKKTE